MSYSYIYVLFSSIIELRCVHSYYHLGPLKRSYFSVGYLPDIVELLPIRLAERREDDVGVFPPKLRGVISQCLSRVSRLDETLANI